MSGTRYPQFCALARAAEILGERWTLLIIRELLIGQRRFSDLAERLRGVLSRLPGVERTAVAKEHAVIPHCPQPLAQLAHILVNDEFWRANGYLPRTVTG